MESGADKISPFLPRFLLTLNHYFYTTNLSIVPEPLSPNLILENWSGPQWPLDHLAESLLSFLS